MSVVADDIVDVLAGAIPMGLAEDLLRDFSEIRHDLATLRVGGGAPGRFVESMVQVLQALERDGSYDCVPKVNEYIRKLESGASALPDGLRICAGRIARAMYSIRSKRNIVHKGTVPTGLYDLRFMHAGAQWLLSELISHVEGLSPDSAARLVASIQVPVGEPVESINGSKLVHGDVTTEQEILLLLMSSHPQPVPRAELTRSLERRAASSIRAAVSSLWKSKTLHKDAAGGLLLTREGVRRAHEIAERLAAA